MVLIDGDDKLNRFSANVINMIQLIQIVQYIQWLCERALVPLNIETMIVQYNN